MIYGSEVQLVMNGRFWCLFLLACTSVRLVLLPVLSDGEEHPIPYYETTDELRVKQQQPRREEERRLKSQAKVSSRRLCMGHSSRRRNDMNAKRNEMSAKELNDELSVCKRVQ